MPIKPRKGESQDAFMARCVPDLMGDGKREQDQAVAACLTIWREDKNEKPPAGKSLEQWTREEVARIVAAFKADKKPKKPYGDVEYADPGYQADKKPRYPVDTADHIRAAWNYINKPKNAKKYSSENLAKVKAKIVAAWKDKIDAKGPPSAADQKAMTALAAVVRAWVLRQDDDTPDPDDDEEHDDFIDRCVDELTDDSDMDEDDAEEACQLKWDEFVSERAHPAPVMHKQHAATETDDPLEFVLSDATPDRFGDVVEPAGWEVDNFKKNPVALFNHDKSFVIGTWDNLNPNDKDLRGHLKLAPRGTSPRIDEIRRLIEAKILRATSVGFRPLQCEPINSNDRMGMLGTRYLKSELIETSIVAIPANPNALAVAKSLNISDDTVRLVFGEHASRRTVRRAVNDAARRGEHANTKRNGAGDDATGEHAEAHRSSQGKPMLLSKRIQDAEKNVLALQDQLEKHLETIDDSAPTEEQMLLTEDLSAKIEAASRNVNNLKAIESRNGAGAVEASTAGEARNYTKPPGDLVLRKKKTEPLDYFFRAAVVRCMAKAQGQTIDDMREKIYGKDEVTRVVCDYALKAATAPAMTTVATWAAELVQQIYADFMQVLLPMSVFPSLASMGLALTFGAAGRIIIPTRNLTPSISGSFVGEGQPIPVRQGAFASQTLTPKKLAVITTWTREMGDHSIPAIEGLLRQAVLEDTAMALDAVLLDANPATVIRPAGLRSYQAGLAATAGAGFDALVGDIKQLYGSLLTLTNGNVRAPVIMMNPQQELAIRLTQPPNAAAPLFPFQDMLDDDKLVDAAVISSATVPVGELVMVDGADFVSAGSEGPRLEISDQATLHMEDTAPVDITGGTPSPATPVKSLWQTDSLALRLIMPMNWLMRRPVVAWTTGVTW